MSSDLEIKDMYLISGENNSRGLNMLLEETYAATETVLAIYSNFIRLLQAILKRALNELEKAIQDA